MFEILSSEIVKMPEVHTLDLSPPAKPKKVKPLPGSSDHQHGENHSFTGWTNVNSPNASQIAQETYRCANLAIVPNKLNEGHPKSISDKPKENYNEQIAIQDLKRKLWIDVTREKPYEESLRSYPKIGNKVSPPNRISTALNPHRSSEFNVVPFYHITSKSRESPLGFPMSPQLQPQQQQRRSSKEGAQSPQGQHTIHSIDLVQSSKNSKTPDLNAIADVPISIKEFRLFKTSIGNINPDKRAATAMKKRHNEPLSLPTTVIGALKPIKLEESRKSKNLRLSKALSLWSQVASPATLPTNNTQPDEIIEGKNHDMLSIDVTELSSYTKTSGIPVPTKTLNFTPSAQKIPGSEIKCLIPLPHFKPTIKVKRPLDVEKSEAETRIFINKLEAVRMRVTSPINLYTKDWDTPNGFPRKISRETGQKSELKRRPFDEAYGENYKFNETFCINTSLKSEGRVSVEPSGDRKDSLYQKMMDRVSKDNGESHPRTKETSLERLPGNIMMNKTYGGQFVKVQGNIGVDGRGAKRHERAIRGITASTDSLKVGKEEIESQQESTKKREVKNFRLFGVRS